MKNETPPVDEIRIFTASVQVGDIIKSPSFKNLLYKDMVDQDPMCGLFVNPYKEYRSWDNSVGFMIEDPGKMKRANAVPHGAGQYISFRMEIDETREFVVIRKFPNCDYPKEQVSENDITGRYPTTVIAKMLAPDGEYDEFGIEITFNMDTTVAKHAVNSVEKVGFMGIDYKRIF
jgi:hypothetical protein